MAASPHPFESTGPIPLEVIGGGVFLNHVLVGGTLQITGNDGRGYLVKVTDDPASESGKKVEFKLSPENASVDVNDFFGISHLTRDQLLGKIPFVNEKGWAEPIGKGFFYDEIRKIALFFHHVACFLDVINEKTDFTPEGPCTHLLTAKSLLEEINPRIGESDLVSWIFSRVTQEKAEKVAAILKICDQA